jgi:hypothetical protein
VLSILLAVFTVSPNNWNRDCEDKEECKKGDGGVSGISDWCFHNLMLSLSTFSPRSTPAVTAPLCNPKRIRRLPVPGPNDTSRRSVISETCCMQARANLVIRTALKTKTKAMRWG